MLQGMRIFNILPVSQHILDSELLWSALASGGFSPSNGEQLSLVSMIYKEKNAVFAHKQKSSASSEFMEVQVR